MIGHAKYSPAERSNLSEVGAANALVVTEYGGEVIPIEVLLLEAARERPTLRLTGNLGAVMRESAEAAHSYVRAIQEVMPSDQNLNRDVHIHVPDNAIPKEGPSAGLTIAVALASAISGRPVRGDIALTGEITLRGKVMAVGGIREKLLAAHRAGIRTVLIPKANATDLDDVPKEIRTKLDVELVDSIDEAMKIALVPSTQKVVVSAPS